MWAGRPKTEPRGDDGELDDELAARRFAPWASTGTESGGVGCCCGGACWGQTGEGACGCVGEARTAEAEGEGDEASEAMRLWCSAGGGAGWAGGRGAGGAAGPLKQRP